jgi:hypothetical protein
VITDGINSAEALEPTSEGTLEELDIASFVTVIIALDDDFKSTPPIRVYRAG